MKQIRKNVFETNSSSTHSIAIPKKCNQPNYVSFSIGEFGWGWEEADAADYFYTAIYVTSDTEKEAEEKINRLKNILDSNNIEYDFGYVDCHEWTSDYNGHKYLSLDNGYIDHGYELNDFVEELLNDEDKLLRFLNCGLVFTGNDNSNTDERCFIERNEKYLDDYDWETRQSFKVKNPYYMSDHEDYDWYYKGN